MCNNQQTNTKMNKYNLGFISDEVIDNHAIIMTTDCVGFHQRLIAQTGDDWELSINGFDVANTKRHIYSFLRTDISKISDKQMRYLMIKMFDKIIKDKDAHCYVVDLNAPSWLDELLTYRTGGQAYWHERLHHTSIATFLNLAFNSRNGIGK